MLPGVPITSGAPRFVPLRMGAAFAQFPLAIDRGGGDPAVADYSAAAAGLTVTGSPSSGVAVNDPSAAGTDSM